jgi:hypothetical protein
MLAWYELEEQLFQEEREALNNKGFSINNQILKIHKKIVFEGNVEVNEETFALKIIYPYGYPYFAPECYMDEIRFARHQAPGGKLCLYEDWKDNSDLNGVDVLNLAMEWINRTRQGYFHPDEEIDGPEPKQYHDVAPNIGTIITPDEVFSDWQCKEGVFKVNLRNLALPPTLYLNGILTGINSEGESYKNHSSLDNLFNVKHMEGELFGRCFQVYTAPPYFTNQTEIITWLEKQGHKDVMKKCRQAAKHLADPNYFIGPILGIKYVDEVGTRDHYESRFLVIALRDILTRKRIRPIQTEFGVFQSNELSPRKLFKRVNELQPLAGKHVVIVGLGTIGAPVALELSKAGVGKLTLVDRDTLNTGNVIRHICDLHHVGLPKVQAVRNVIYGHNPYAEVFTRVEDWGMSTSDEDVTACLREVDLVVCAVGHTPTEEYLNKMAYYFNIPVIYAYAGSGAWSGRVFRVEPGVTGCYNCHQWKMYEESDLKLTKPDEEKEIFDHGCATPAYPGSGIDTGTLAILASRLSIQTILVEHPNSYEPSVNDHFVWVSQGNNGELKLVQKKVEKHPKCKRCTHEIHVVHTQ